MLVSSVPLSLTTIQGVPRISMARPSSRATRSLESELSKTNATHSRLKSSTTASTRNLRLDANASDTKSNDQVQIQTLAMVDIQNIMCEFSKYQAIKLGLRDAAKVSCVHGRGW